jgi:hypothetical protein
MKEGDEVRRVLILAAMMCFSATVGGGPAWSKTPPPPLGGTAWDVTGGKLKVSITVPMVARVQMELLNLGLLEDVLHLCPDGVDDGDLPDFFDTVLGMTGSWSQTGSRYAVDLGPFIEDLATQLMEFIAARLEGASAEVTVYGQGIAGRARASTITGKVTGDLLITVYADGSTIPVSVKITGSFSGALHGGEACPVTTTKAGGRSSRGSLGLVEALADAILSSLAR